MFDPDDFVPAGSCDRRHFLGLSAALALGALAGRTADATRPEVVVIGLGGAGINIARRVHADGLTARYWHWNRANQVGKYPHLPGSYRLDVPDPLLGTGSEVHLAGWIRSMLDQLRAPVHRVAVVAGLGGRTGSALLPAVVQELASRGPRVGAYCTLPASFEGTNRRVTAERALATLAATGALPRLVRLDDVLRSAGPGTSLKQVIGEADGRLARPMRRFLSAR
jgi:cell division GTPase FtsZ